MKIQAEDRLGNKIYSKNGIVYLYLVGNGTRNLGEVYEGDLYVRRLNRHKFKKLNAYGFNYNLLKQLDPLKKIYVRQEDKTVLEILVQEALVKGKLLNFSKNGFELQIFVPIENFIFRK